MKKYIILCVVVLLFAVVVNAGQVNNLYSGNDADLSRSNSSYGSNSVQHIKSRNANGVKSPFFSQSNQNGWNYNGSVNGRNGQNFGAPNEMRSNDVRYGDSNVGTKRRYNYSQKANNKKYKNANRNALRQNKYGSNNNRNIAGRAMREYNKSNPQNPLSNVQRSRRNGSTMNYSNSNNNYSRPNTVSNSNTSTQNAKFDNNAVYYARKGDKHYYKKDSNGNVTKYDQNWNEVSE